MNLQPSRLLMALIIWLPTLVIAADLDTAVSAYEAGEYRTAYRHLKHLVLSDHPKAQYLMGLMYYQGQGVEQDVAEGIDWLKQAAANGSYLAAAELGQIYLAGAGVELNEAEAAKWIQLSTDLAEADDAEGGCD